VMKDVASCDKPGLGACDHRSQDLRMRSLIYTPLLYAGEGELSEVKHLSRTRKRNQARFR
jgi:hypothetical protein